MTRQPPTSYARLTDLNDRPVSVHASPAWAAREPSVWIATTDRAGHEHRPALLSVEQARAVRDALTRFLRDQGESA